MNNNFDIEDIACPFGCASDDEVVLCGRDLIHQLPGDFYIVKCRSCNLMRTNPRPTAKTIKFFYPDNYGPYLGTQIALESPHMLMKVRSFLRPYIKKIFNFNNHVIPKKSPGKLLELGCASGVLLHKMAADGWEVEGIEFSEKAAKLAMQYGYRVHDKALECVSDINGPFDLIVGWMVLEHLHDPLGGLMKLHKWSQRGTKLVMSVPNCGSFDFNLFKENTHRLHLPAHLYHFTPDSLREMLQRSGWQLEEIFHQRTLETLMGGLGLFLVGKGAQRFGNLLLGYSTKGGTINYLLYPLAYLFSIFGQTGRMTFWASYQE